MAAEAGVPQVNPIQYANFMPEEKGEANEHLEQSI